MKAVSPFEPKEKREFTCFDDSPENNGWGYNSRWGDDDEEDLEDDVELEIVRDDE